MFLPEPSGKSFAPAPAGNHIAICYRFLDLGTQAVEWQGQQKLQHKVMISWELPNETIPDGELAGQPYSIHQRYTWSMSEKATLRKHLESWRGRAFGTEDFVGPKRFDIKNIVGKPCMLQVVHATKDGKTYSNIAAVAAMPKGMAAPEMVNEAVFLGLTPDEFRDDVFNSLSDRLRETIQASPEYKSLIGGEPMQAETGDNFHDDEIPF
jgi:hypothetical protein